MLKELSNELLISLYKKAVILSKDTTIIKVLKEEIQKRNLLQLIEG
ncbi:sporulation histidine kinase inhibitor Sda [Metabacillus halosaccharovorans]|nr:sporulation histidine kinase inhibitor Sda [Metabacillus halosaccharovorans]MCM3440364.1 sporulation histidine kinase inhibitor Sda [Metabacillus halosaccharovorans]